jgi:hypothetical protein
VSLGKLTLKDKLMKLYPTRIECVCGETSDLLFIIENIDGCAASVNIKTCVTPEYWDELALKVKEALVLMDLGS